MDQAPATGPDFSRGGGLLPAIAQDAESGEVLMMAYMNAESYAETLATGRAVYFSRSRKKLWRRARRAATFNASAPFMWTATSMRSSFPSNRSAGPPATKATRVAFFARLARRGWKWSPSGSLTPPRCIKSRRTDGKRLETWHPRRQLAGSDGGTLPPRRIQDRLQFAKLLSVDRRRRDRVPADPPEKWPATCKTACWTPV